MSTSSPPSPPPKPQTDWSANQYLKFSSERTRPVYDLLTRLHPLLRPSAAPQIHDLGCGPGNSTAVLANFFPTARITGMDSSPDMLAKARRAGIPNASFVQGDLASYDPGAEADLVFSNAAFHWLRGDARLPTLKRLLEALREGGVLALQVPNNYYEPSHAGMRAVATKSDAPWAAYFPEGSVGELSNTQRPDLDPVESVNEIYDALAPYASLVDVWNTTYYHRLGGAAEIVEWVKGTGLRPFLDAMGEDERAREAFLEAYEKEIARVYPKVGDGNVLLGYPRLFVVAVRK